MGAIRLATTADRDATGPALRRFAGVCDLAATEINRAAGRVVLYNSRLFVAPFAS